MTETLKKKHGKVTLVGFGTFSKSHRKARKGRNPKTGDMIKVKAPNVVNL
ncbi:HU family DNA-binding protein [Thermodesulfobacteriota bacterium]